MHQSTAHVLRNAFAAFASHLLSGIGPNTLDAQRSPSRSSTRQPLVSLHPLIYVWDKDALSLA